MHSTKRGNKMEDELPKKQTQHEIGMSLDDLSIDELEKRIILLQGEVKRLQSSIISKKASLESAQAFFK